MWSKIISSSSIPYVRNISKVSVTPQDYWSLYHCHCQDSVQHLSPLLALCWAQDDACRYDLVSATDKEHVGSLVPRGNSSLCATINPTPPSHSSWVNYEVGGKVPCRVCLNNLRLYCCAHLTPSLQEQCLTSGRIRDRMLEDEIKRKWWYDGRRFKKGQRKRLKEHNKSGSYHIVYFTFNYFLPPNNWSYQFNIHYCSKT